MGGIRDLRMRLALAPQQMLRAVVSVRDSKRIELFRQFEAEIKRLGRLESLAVEKDFPRSRAYVGNAFSPQRPWESGARLAAGVRWEAGPYLGIGYTVLPSIDASTDNMAGSVERHPGELVVGFSLGSGSWGLAGEIAGMADYLVRSTRVASFELVARDSHARWLWGVSPRVRLSSRHFSGLEIFVSAGVDFFPKNADYAIEVVDEPPSPEGEPTVSNQLILTPRTVRFTAAGGVSFGF